MRSSTKKAGRDCPDWETLVSYFQMALLEGEAAVVDEHLAECDLCIDLARAAHDRALALDNWTAASHGAAWKRELISRAVEELSGSADEPLAARLKTWRENLRDVIAGALEVLTDLKLTAAGLSEIIRPGGWRFEPVGALRGNAGHTAGAAMLSRTNGLKVEVLPDGSIRILAPDWPKNSALPSVVIIDKTGDRPAVNFQLQRDSAGRVTGSLPATPADSLIIFLSDLREEL